MRTKHHGGMNGPHHSMRCHCTLPPMDACPMQGPMASGLRPLPEFPAGTMVVIGGIDGGHRLRCRLLAMGLTPGSMLQMGANSCGGCCVRVRDADLFLGQGMCEKILARPATETDADGLAVGVENG